MTISDALLTSKSDEWATPMWLFKKLQAIFDFRIDTAATPENALCSEYFTQENSGTAQLWKGTAWCNPPYSVVSDFVRIAHDSAIVHGTKSVLLIPARTDTRYWHDFIFGKADILFIKGRLKFGDSKNSAPFPSALVIYNGSREELLEMWLLELGFLQV